MKSYFLQSILYLSLFCISTVAFADKPLYSLTDNKGRSVTSNTYAGSTQFVFFGFAHCPHVCPSALVTMKTAYSSLDNTQQSLIQPVFITIDPARDTVDAIDHYVEKLDGFVGLTGSDVDIKKTLNKFKVFAVKQIGQQKDNYDISHTSLIYVINKSGEACESISSDLSIEALAEKMSVLSSDDSECVPAS